MFANFMYFMGILLFFGFNTRSSSRIPEIWMATLSIVMILYASKIKWDNLTTRVSKLEDYYINQERNHGVAGQESARQTEEGEG
jgi:hypothetical protein